ncbi:MAG TPA: cytochrome C [Gammaproteobacteria bacterium]|nr:cytochrome C [Gammaproteobacteria bacterium]
MLNKILALFFLLLPVTNLCAAEFTDQECTECHGVKGFAVPMGEHGESRKRSLDINVSALHESAHGKLKCVECHRGIKKLPHRKEKLETVDCVSCHIDSAKTLTDGRDWRGLKKARKKQISEVVINTERYTHSVHADTRVKNNANCAACHTAHYVYKSSNPKASTYRENSPQMCGECHDEALREYKRSIHGAALKTPWKGDSATCSDCHSSHEISKKDSLSAHRVVTKNCGNCHKKEVASYMATTHGQLAWHGNKKVPRCVDCHRGHETRKIDDPASKVSQQNRLKTCRECHKDAGAGIVSYKAHGNTHDFKRYPGMFVTGKLMIYIVIAVLIFFYSHSMLWFYREYKSRVFATSTSDSLTVRYRVKPKKKHSEVHFQRYAWYWRVNHWLLAISVMTLVFTGMAVMYADTPWAVAVVKAVGGPGVFGIIHRTAGIMFLLAVVGHGVILLSHLLKDKNFKWFGPDSMLPRMKDWADMKAQFRWFFGKGKPPRLDRFTYWEKFDYWAVYWGAFVIGTSGIVLWASPILLRFLPGWVFNIASIAHGVEAFLAVTTLFVVHFFNNHFRPAKFPLDIVMFTGSWDLEEFKEERPQEYERLKASGELEKRLVPPPSRRAVIISHIIGFTLLTVGISLLIMVLIGFSNSGLT